MNNTIFFLIGLVRGADILTGVDLISFTTIQAQF